MPQTRAHKAIASPSPGSSREKRKAGFGRRLAAIAAVILVTACGYRGPLYLPEDEPGGPQAQEQTGGEPEAAAGEGEDIDEDDEDEDRERAPSS